MTFSDSAIKSFKNSAIDDYAKDADQRWSDIYVVFTKIYCGRNLCLISYKAKIHRTASNGFTESLSTI